MPGSGQQPATQRVGAGRRVPVVVALAVVLFVGALVWKPWDEPQPAPRSAPPLAAVATTKPEPTPMTVPPSLATPPPATPRPSIAASPVPSEPAGATAAAAQVALTSEPGGAYAQCRYRTRDDGAGNLLARVTVKAPTVIVSRRLARDENVRRVAWQVELQANQLESVFSAEWRTVARSRRQRAPVDPDRPARFEPLTVSVGQHDIGPTSVLRAVVIVEWYGPRRALLGSRTIVAKSYEQGASPSAVLPEGCRAIRA